MSILDTTPTFTQTFENVCTMTELRIKGEFIGYNEDCEAIPTTVTIEKNVIRMPGDYLLIEKVEKMSDRVYNLTTEQGVFTLYLTETKELKEIIFSPTGETWKIKLK